MRLPAPGAQILLLALWLSVLGACTMPPPGQTTVPEQDKPASALLTEPDSQPEQAAGLLQAPLLRLDTGMHTAAILKMGIDAAHRYLVTASLDKTIRVWELASGRLVRTIRPPIGLGDEGKLYALAISPDGTTVAAGGATSYAWDAAYAIYIFDRDSGRLRQRLTGLPGTIQHLAYARDGKVLVATLRNKGIRFYRTPDYVQVASDMAYGDRSVWADFDAAGRLVTSAYDGFIRLYDQAGQLRTKHRVPAGALPHGVAFSPDGSRLAVGFSNSTSVHVLSGADLALLYTAGEKDSAKRHAFSRVAWAAHSNVLYAAGWFPIKGVNPIRRWTEAGQGVATDLPLAQHAFSQMLSLPDNRLLFTTLDPAFGILDATGQAQFSQESTGADFRADWRTFRLSQDGTTVQFHYRRAGGSLASFALSKRLLTSRPVPDTALAPAVTSAPGLNLSAWQDSFSPTLNGTAIKLSPHERALSVAIAPDQQRFLLGAEWSLRLFDRSGKQLWRVAAPGTTWRVNIAGNGEVAVAAFGDGTIRWFRLSDGRELLAFFPHADRKRWVLWTPAGYYDAAPGAEDMLGWHVNRGRDQEADFFPVARFRSVFFRPDVVAAALQAGGPTAALRQATAGGPRTEQDVDVSTRLPPVIEIKTPQDGATTTTALLTVRFSLRTPAGAPVTALKGLIDGRPVTQTRGLLLAGQGDEIRALQIPVPPHDCEVTLIAENQHAASEPASIKLRWGGANAGAATKPKLYVLAVGISQYQNRSLTLGLAAKDAQDFASTMQRQQGRMYRDVEVKQLTNAMATRAALLEAFSWLEQQVKSGDVAAIFLAGHGFNDSHGDYYFLPTDIDTERVQRTGVALTDFRNIVAALRGRVLLFVDTCHAGNILWKQGRGTLSVTGVVNELASAENGAVVFAAATGNQVSREDQAWGNGAFTKALVEGLEGQAASPGTGRITFLRLGEYIAERVETLTQGQQTPTLTPSPNVPNFPVALAP